LKRSPVEIRKEVENILEKNSFAPLDGLAGEMMVNVLQVNLDLRISMGCLNNGIRTDDVRAVTAHNENIWFTILYQERIFLGFWFHTPQMIKVTQLCKIIP